MHYTDNYPDELPELSLEPLEGVTDEEEMDTLLDSTRAVVSMLACLSVQRIGLIRDPVGSGKYRDGDDLHYRLASTRAAIKAYSD